MAEADVLSSHGIHVGTGASQVREVAFEAGHPGDGFHLAQNALLAPADDEFALVGTDGAEGTSSEASAVEVDRELDHVIGRYALALVLRVRQPGVWEVERAVQFLLCHGRVGRIDHREPAVHPLDDALCLQLVALLLNVAEVLGLLPLVVQALFVGVQQQVVGAESSGYLIFLII